MNNNESDMLKKSATYSIVARCTKENALGICVASGSLAVGSVVPHIKLDTGAIITQGLTNIEYGIEGMKLLTLGFSPDEVLTKISSEDPKKDFRQVVIMDSKGLISAYTGIKTEKWSGHIIGDNYAVAGNMLSNPNVLKSMANAYEGSKGPLEDRLIVTIKVGQKTGGDVRGERSSALLVGKKELQQGIRPYIDLRVDENVNPIGELERILNCYKSFYGLT